MQAKRSTTKIRPKAVGGGISAVFSNFDKCRSEADDVIYSVAVDYVSTDVRAIFGVSGLNSGRMPNYSTL